MGEVEARRLRLGEQGEAGPEPVRPRRHLARHPAAISLERHGVDDHLVIEAQRPGMADGPEGCGGDRAGGDAGDEGGAEDGLHQSAD